MVTSSRTSLPRSSSSLNLDVSPRLEAASTDVLRMVGYSETEKFTWTAGNLSFRDVLAISTESISLW